MEISASTAPGGAATTILHLSGDLDATSEGQLVDRAREAVAEGAEHLVIDLASVRYVSSAGMRGLHKVYLLLRPPGDEAALLQGVRAGTYTAPNLRLAGPKEDVRTVLSITGLDMYLQVHPDVASALESL